MQDLTGKLPRLLEQVQPARAKLREAERDVTERFSKLKAAVDAMDQAFSGSWLGYHSRTFYTNFQTPRRAFDIEWGEVRGPQSDWREYTPAEVTEHIERQAGTTVEELCAKVTHLDESYGALRTDLLTSLAALRGTAGFEHEIELLVELDNLRLGSSARELLSAWTPRNHITRDSTASYQGIKVPPHYAYQSEVAECISKLTGWKAFMEKAERLVREVTVRLDTVDVRTDAARSGGSRKVLIIHGHADAARLELVDLLEKRFDLPAVVLAEIPHRGRTIIEKLEQEASDCAFAFAIFTPDDFIDDNGDIYAQARPNVIFELGWFYGKWGREYTAVLYQRETKLPSDMAGIGWVPFGKSVKEAFLDIESELKTAGLVNQP